MCSGSSEHSLCPAVGRRIPVGEGQEGENSWPGCVVLLTGNAQALKPGRHFPSAGLELSGEPSLNFL